MRSISGREFARMVERRGWQLLRVNGSHHVYGKAGGPRRCVLVNGISSAGMSALPLARRRPKGILYEHALGPRRRQ